MTVPRSLLAAALSALFILDQSPAYADAAPGAPEKVSKPFVYSGYSHPEYTNHRVFSVYVPMADGVKLAVDVFIPTEGPERSTFPVILEYTPYRRADINPATGEISDLSNTEEGRFFLPYGYAMVCADMRGTGASAGSLMDFMPKLGEDGKNLVDWIAAQPWCDGKVGMMGNSYLGWSQTATASYRPKALKCIMPGVIPLDGYTGEVSPGGIFLQGFFAMWGSWMDHILRNEFLPSDGVRPSKPVVDEDQDGDLADEIPVDANGNGAFLDDGPPKYRDGATRQDLYYKATADHDKGNYDYAEWASKLRFINDKSPLGFSMYELGPGGHVPGLAASGIPVYNVGGWFDAFTRGSTELYATLAKTNPSKLLMPPSYHDFNTGPFWKHFGFDRDKVNELTFTEHLRFFDCYLKGIRNGIDTEPPICLYVMNGGGWRAEKEWPLARQVLTRYYCDEDQALTAERKAVGQDQYRADFTHDSSYGGNKGNRYLGIGMESPDQVPTRAAQDAQCLVYTSAPMTSDTEVTGHPAVHFWVGSTAEDGDFYVYLEDVDGQGTPTLVTEGQLRAGFAALHSNDAMILGGKSKIDVLPELPWHGFEAKDYLANVFAKGAAVELVIDFNPTSWVFKQGHRIRVSLACADFPTFALHPTLSPSNDPKAANNTAPTITVYRNADHPSYVELPIIPAGPAASASK